MADPITCYIAGVKFRQGADARLAAMDPGTVLTLEPEHGNKYDPNAVKIMHDGFQVGYVPAFLSAKVRRLMDAGAVGIVSYGGDRTVVIPHTEEAPAAPTEPEADDGTPI